MGLLSIFRNDILNHSIVAAFDLTLDMGDSLLQAIECNQRVEYVSKLHLDGLVLFVGICNDFEDGSFKMTFENV